MYNDNFGGRPRRGGGGGGRGGFSNRPQMHDAVCDNCGNDCKVPFRPSGDKPIFCSDCFEKKGGRDGGRDSGRDRGDRGDRGMGGGDNGMGKLSANIEQLNNKLDVIIRLLSKTEKAEVQPEKKAEKKAKAPKK